VFPKDDPVKKAIIVGASSGIGRELVRVLSRDSYIVGMAARRLELLSELQGEIDSKSYTKQIDISLTDETRAKLNKLIEEMDGVDVAIISAAVYLENPDLDWNLEKSTIDTNVSGFCAAVNVFFRYFLKKGSGHIVGISSIISHRGDHLCTSYSASKAFVSNYLEGLQKRVLMKGLNIQITIIEPGYVNTPMIKDVQDPASVMSAEEAALQIYGAIKKKKDHIYVSKRWRIFLWMRKIMPWWLYKRLSTKKSTS